MSVRPAFLVSLVSVLTATGAFAESKESAEPLVSVSLSGDRLSDVVARLGKQYGYKIAYDSGLSGDLRASQVYVASAPASQAFAIIAAAYGACARTMEHVVVFRACDLRIRPSVDPETGPMKVQLGIVIEEVAIDGSEAGAAGVKVADVFNDLPASKAGIRPGDLILAYNGEVVTESRQLRRLVGNTEPGSHVPVQVMRGSERLDLTARF